MFWYSTYGMLKNFVNETLCNAFKDERNHHREYILMKMVCVPWYNQMKDRLENYTW